MNQPALVHFYHPKRGARIGVEIDGLVHDVTAITGSLTDWLAASANRVQAAIDDLIVAAESDTDRFAATELAQEPLPTNLHWLPPELKDAYPALVDGEDDPDYEFGGPVAGYDPTPTVLTEDQLIY